MAQKLFSKEWKLSYEAIPTKSTASLVRLYDLFYKDDGTDSLNTWYADSASKKGCNIGHDIICLNSKLYDTNDGGLNDEIKRLSYLSWETSDLNIYGIDIAIPYYDRRMEPQTIQYEEGFLPAGKKVGEEISLTSFWLDGQEPDDENAEVKTTKVSYSPYLLDKSDVIPYNDIYSFSINGVCSTVCQYINGRSNLGAIGVLKDSSNVMMNISQTSIPFPTVGAYSPANASNFDIYLIGEDEAFHKNTLVLDRFKPYNYMFINPDSSYGRELIYRALFNSYSKGNGAPTVEKFSAKGVFGKYTKFYNPENEIERHYYIKALKNTYVWVRAPFFGDYIKPESFEQELNTKSEVAFKDLLLAEPGVSLDKYDTGVGVGPNLDDITFVETDDSQRKTPYRPQTTPLFDSIAISKNLGTVERTDEKFGGVSEPISPTKITYNNSDSTGQANLSHTYNPDYKGFPFSPRVNNTTGEDSNLKDKTVEDLAKTIPPTVFYDDEFKTKTEYFEGARNPVVLPKSGNAFIDGRIISPTIDEILYTIKELTSGRIADTREANKLQDIDSRPYNVSDQLSVDTVFDEAKYSDFKFYKESDDLANVLKAKTDGSYKSTEDPAVIGDPLHISYDDENGYVVDKWVNQPKSITYPLYHELRELSERATQHENFENYVVSNFKDIEYSYDSDPSMSGSETLKIRPHHKRSIENLSAWLTNDLDGCNKMFGDGSNRNEKDNLTVNKNVLPVDSKIYYNDGNYGVFWGPRPAPYSLRELEALVKGLKYNLLSMFRFIVQNFTLTGGLGKSNKTELTGNNEYSHYAGSLYQLHKDYNFESDRPNTFFKRDGNGTFDNGMMAQFDDATNLQSKHAAEKDHTKNYNKNTNYPLEKDYGWGAVNGISPNQLEYSSADVYLAADGTWRYIFDNVRMPILKSDY